MEENKRATEAAPKIDTANVHNPNAMSKVLEYIRYTV